MIIIKTPSQIEQIRQNGIIHGQALQKAMEATKIGTTTAELDRIIENHITADGGIPTFKGYGKNKDRPAFPKSSCISINDVLVHGIPGKQKVKDGDIISIDVGVTKNDMIVDGCISYSVGNISEQHKNLLQAAQEITLYGINLCKPGMRIHDLGLMIEKYAESLGYMIFSEFYGHGTGIKLHEDPVVVFCDHRKVLGFIPNPVLQEGMIITIEPVVGTQKDDFYFEDKDCWTIRTTDKSYTAQFEHTVLITKDGYQILTQPFPKNLNI